MSELKPCPFCGGEADIMEYDNSFAIRCKTPNCPVYVFTINHKDLSYVKKVWNTRHEPTCETVKSEILCEKKDILAAVMCKEGMTHGFAEVRRLVYGKAIKVNEELATSWRQQVNEGDVITCGKHKKDGSGEMTEYVFDLSAFESDNIDDGLREKIVRCKDCLYYHLPSNKNASDELCWKHSCFYYPKKIFIPDSNGFCAWAKRKEM